MNNLDDATVHCCANCGSEAGGGVSLKACMSCMHVKYCNADCQRNHWPTNKKLCKQHAAKRRDEALFKDHPPKEDCPICFLPMPLKIISCISLPPATIMSVPIYDFAKANEVLANTHTENYYSCCGKTICMGCGYSFRESGNNDKCPFCNADRCKTDEEHVEDIKRRVEVNDANSVFVLGNYYYHGKFGLLQDHARAIELYARAADLGSSEAHFHFGAHYEREGDMKKAKFHYEAAAMAGHEGARCNVGCMEARSRNMERAVKHVMIAALAGNHCAMYNLLIAFNKGLVPREEIESALAAYNNSCTEMRSEARDAAIRLKLSV